MTSKDMTSKEKIEELSQEIRSIIHCPLGHDYRKIMEMKDKDGTVVVILRCERCEDVQERPLTETMARQFLMPRTSEQISCLLFFGHKWADTKEIDPITGKPRRICSLCGAEDWHQLKKALGLLG